MDERPPPLQRPPRADLGEPYPPLAAGDADAPLALFDAGEIASVVAALTLLERIAARAGTRHAPSSLAALRDRASRALPSWSRALVEDEVDRVARWLDEPARAQRDAADLDARRRPAADLADVLRLMKEGAPERAALLAAVAERGDDAELEYYDPQTGAWLRVRATPLGVSGEGVDALVRIAARGRPIEIEAIHIRWAMAVKPGSALPLSGGARVLSGPWRDAEQE